jgi:hypothetical protein
MGIETNPLTFQKLMVQWIHERARELCRTVTTKAYWYDQKTVDVTLCTGSYRDNDLQSFIVKITDKGVDDKHRFVGIHDPELIPFLEEKLGVCRKELEGKMLALPALALMFVPPGLFLIGLLIYVLAAL